MTFSELFLSKWMPTLLAGAISFLAAWIFKSLESSRYYKDKRIERADLTISYLSDYIENWRKLISISTLRKQRKLTETEKKRLERYILKRDEAKQSLTSSINTLTLYFNKKVVLEVRKFRSWDSQQSTKRLDDLPPIQEWEKWGDRLSDIFRRNI